MGCPKVGSSLAVDFREHFMNIYEVGKIFMGKMTFFLYQIWRSASPFQGMSCMSSHDPIKG